jgi:orotate phosphoribosyltransferase
MEAVEPGRTKSVDDLIEEAGSLSERGFSKGAITDGSNVSRETASWLVDRSDPAPVSADAEATVAPHDIHVDWSALGRDSARLSHVGKAMADLLSKQGEAVDLTVGIENAGVPLATVVAEELDADIAAYAPAKHRWEEGDIDEFQGSFSRDFADIRDRECYVVDDTITSGTTMTETIEAIREQGGDPVVCVVLVDKQGVEEVDGVPVYSLIRAIRVGNSDWREHGEPPHATSASSSNWSGCRTS